MPRKVEGYMTDNGNFFPSAEEAEFHEAESILRDKVLDAEVDPDRFMPLVIQFEAEVRRYIDAYEKQPKLDGNSADEQEATSGVASSESQSDH